MTIRKNKYTVKDIIKPENVLVSVYDKTNLDVLVNGLVEFNPEIIFYSTGGTGEKIKEILGNIFERNFISIEDFTRCPEMEGGLVKTLHPKIHAGILAERGNPEHKRYLEEDMKKMTGTPGVYFDLLVCNIYPFREVTNREDCTPETARTYIDIGGPTMIRAACKNWHSIGVMTNSATYDKFIEHVNGHNGIALEERFMNAKLALTELAYNATAVRDYIHNLYFDKDVKSELNLEE